MAFLFVRLADVRCEYSESKKPSLLGEFADLGIGDWTGFYDWLRTAAGCIIGIRFWPFDRAGFLLDLVETGPRARVEDPGALLLFFGEETNFDVLRSDDQAMEEARVLRDKSGAYGLLFGCSDLTTAELEHLKQQCKHCEQN